MAEPEGSWFRADQNRLECDLENLGRASFAGDLDRALALPRARTSPGRPVRATHWKESEKQ